MWPWNDPSGRLSRFKLAVFIALFVPGALTALDFALGNLGARPVMEAIHQTGLWTIRLLFISLAVTPLRAVLDGPRLLQVRRMIGVAAFAYALVHLTLYAADEMFVLPRIASEIVLRIYLTIGFVTLLGLAALAITSTDGWQRRLRDKWRKLHKTIYLLAVLASVHFFMQSKADVAEPMMMMGFYAWLMGYRALARRTGRGGRLPAPWLAGLGVVAIAATALGEALWFWATMHVAPGRVLMVNFVPDAGFRPAWGVALAVALVLAGFWGRRAAKEIAKRGGLRDAFARQTGAA